MSVKKPRISSKIQRRTAAILGISAVFALATQVVAQVALDFRGSALRPTAEITNDAYAEQRDHVWLELDELAADISVAAEPTNDLFAILRRNFSLEPVQNKRIQAELNWFVKNPSYLNRVFNRAQRYLPFIIDELETRKLPFELALLPVVESAFDPFAYSHGRAAGLWQIIPGTGRRFGIRQNWWYDGRRDAVDSTRGALEYLAYLHDLMDGDWPLAIASYNSGEGNVLKAVKRNRARSKPTDFWNLSLSRETSAYVPRLMALVELVRNPEKYNLELPELIDEPQFVVADIGSQVDLALAAELAGIELDTLYAYNAGNNRWSTDPAGPHRLVLPIDVADEFTTALAAIPEKERIRWKRHKVRNGEAISQIAERYNTTISTIRTANNLKGNSIRAGAHLMIPVSTKPLDEYNLSAEGRREKKQNTVRKGNRIEHIVAAGESFWTISRRYNVNMNKLAAWNGTAPRDTLSIGQKLVVWTSASVPTSAVSGNGLTRKLNYTVRNGDSLYLIASRFRIKVNDLVRWNNIDKNKILRPGQKLTMYVDVTAQSS
ncbi:MAG: LysM peptidoglycan-binding domain-containing protein [Woeseiaceae bacterium]